jgi:hypothetical protein
LTYLSNAEIFCGEKEDEGAGVFPFLLWLEDMMTIRNSDRRDVS